ncbi:MAG: hypothetical protein NTY38_15710 [Acidobacteria bacterium]|nr:hypothetical protein [Acidobacteriota bacterium]
MLVYLGNRPDGLTLNAPITLVMTTNPSGADIFGPVFYQLPGKVASTGGFVEYPLPEATINSGDFVVGFAVDNPANLLPADLDVSTPSQKRSYLGFGGAIFNLLSGLGLDGNLGIRAKVSVTQP